MFPEACGMSGTHGCNNIVQHVHAYKWLLSDSRCSGVAKGSQKDSIANFIVIQPKMSCEKDLDCSIKMKLLWDKSWQSVDL